MHNRSKIDRIFRQQDFAACDSSADCVYGYAESMAILENCVVVVSDLKYGTRRIFNGGFSATLGLSGTYRENSIWEKEILDRMTDDERDMKYIAELRFYNFLCHMPSQRRRNYYMAANLRMMTDGGMLIDVMHRMFYWHEGSSDAVRYGICVYGPSVFSLPAKSVAVDAVTGQWHELSALSDDKILTARQKQVLCLIARGLTSIDIAQTLSISRNTVSRHRQEILAKLQVSNSMEACRRAKQLNII